MGKKQLYQVLFPVLNHLTITKANAHPEAEPPVNAPAPSARRMILPQFSHVWETASSLVAAGVGVGLVALVGNLSESELLLELASELAQGGDELLADVHQSLAGRHCTVGLDAK